MPWLQIKLDIQPDLAEEYEDLLLELGSCAVTLEDGADQPLFEPDIGSTPLWDKTRITGLYDAEINLAELLNQLKQGHLTISPKQPFPTCKSEILEDKDWEREWMENFHPMQFGERLWVCPSWKEVPDPSAANLMLDPGLAFGTGTHPTTALCLEWLSSQDCEDRVIVDYGCGSGILGIAALLLGAKHLIGTDIDPQALQASQENANRNNIPPSCLEFHYPDKMPEVEADIVVANILSGPLVELAPTISKLVKPGGHLVLSGVLESQKQGLIAAYEPWFDLSPAVNQEEWIRLSGVKR